ncbi:2-keto-4-pentenoate hydratase [Mycolicibacterium tusciae]|uniref:2-keto-4-pentenoate hydratase n=1 Tax=Mycolicibacterium tusciae TaxID=75922 RepID=UPI001EF84DA8|nr:fumarylacetoacetate hydrolase family protein [Mycolicibacterium tusciae]
MHPAMTAQDGYAVQRELTALLHDTGERTTGFKIGLTSRAMQTSLGVSTPDYGPVLSSSTCDSGVTLDFGDFIAPRVECEIALVLDQDLVGPGITALDIRRAAGGAVAALEVVDSRIQNWRLQLPDTIADLASFGAAVLSNQVVSLHDLDLKTLGAALMINGSNTATGAGAASLGDPLKAAAWLVNTLGEHDIICPAGCFILTGALHAAIPLNPGDVVSGLFSGLGAVSLQLTKPAQPQ